MPQETYSAYMYEHGPDSHIPCRPCWYASRLRAITHWMHVPAHCCSSSPATGKLLRPYLQRGLCVGARQPCASAPAAAGSILQAAEVRELVSEGRGCRLSRVSSLLCTIPRPCSVLHTTKVREPIPQAAGCRLPGLCCLLS